MRKLRYKDEECLKITLGQSHPFQFEYEAPSLSVLRLALRFSHMNLFPVFSTLASSCVPASVPAVPAAWNVVDPSFTQLTPTHPLRLTSKPCKDSTLSGQSQSLPSLCIPVLLQDMLSYLFIKIFFLVMSLDLSFPPTPCCPVPHLFPQWKCSGGLEVSLDGWVGVSQVNDGSTFVTTGPAGKSQDILFYCIMGLCLYICVFYKTTSFLRQEIVTLSPLFLIIKKRPSV